MIIRLHPEAFNQSPLHVYSLLLLGQQYTHRTEFLNDANAVWSRIRQVAPFNQIGPSGRAKWRFVIYCDDGFGLDLGIVQAGNVLSIPSAASDRLVTYLAGASVPGDDGTSTWASDIWPKGGSAGRNGSLVAVLAKGTSPGELYQLNATSDYPVRLVGAVVTGDFWPMLIIRAIGQTLGGLVDEYELDGPDFDKVPSDVLLQPPNVLVIDDDQRGSLAAGDDPAKVIDLPSQWKAFSGQLSFIPHESPGTNPLNTAQGGIQLVEGGAGYRHNVLRADLDCLLRRIPASVQPRPTNADQLPVQDDIDFCKVCRTVLEFAVKGQPGSFNLAQAVRIHLGSQQTFYDRIGSSWQQKQPQSLASLPFKQSLADTSAPSGVQWSCDVEVNNEDGLKITNLKLQNRPDMFSKAGANDVMESISFKDLSVTFDTGSPVQLNVADALANTRRPPSLEIGQVAGEGNLWRIGIKLTLCWDKWPIEVTMSLVLRDMKNDFDPGGAAGACKLYPQLALRYLESPPLPGGRPKVAELKGTIAFVANNVISPSAAAHLDPSMQNMASGKLGITLATDSNSSRLDNNYDVSIKKFPPYPVTLPIFPYLADRASASWVSGRKLAGLSTDPAYLANVARYGYVHLDEPPLPHWSWLFDYIMPVPSTPSHPFQVVYRRGEPTGDHYREIKFPWPLAGDLSSPPPSPGFVMTVQKLARQGAYDSIHLQADMGVDDVSRPIVPAPFCADLCVHLHFRWGIVALSGASFPQSFDGWGDGSPAQGAHSSRGFPLVPPNQHIEIAVTRQTGSTGLDKALVEYRASAADPQGSAWQVFLEQGIGFAFTYDGLDRDKLKVLGMFLNLPAEAEQASSDAKQFGKRSEQFDLSSRMFFRKVYATIRWFDSSIDGTNKIDVQQVSGNPVDPVLENL